MRIVRNRAAHSSGQPVVSHVPCAMYVGRDFAVVHTPSFLVKFPCLVRRGAAESCASRKRVHTKMTMGSGPHQQVAAIAAVAVVGVSLLWWLRRRGRSSAATPQMHGISMDVLTRKLQMVADTQDAVEPPSHLEAPVPGFICASVQPAEGFGGFIPEDTDADGPPSTDEEEDDEEDKVESWASFRGKRYAREGSFRQRSEEKVERAQGLKAKSDSLTSILCTPAQHNRKVDENKMDNSAAPLGSRTVVGTHRRLKERPEWAEGGRDARAAALMPIPAFKARSSQEPRPSPRLETLKETSPEAHESGAEAMMSPILDVADRATKSKRKDKERAKQAADETDKPDNPKLKKSNRSSKAVAAFSSLAAQPKKPTTASSS